MSKHTPGPWFPINPDFLQVPGGAIGIYTIDDLIKKYTDGSCWVANVNTQFTSIDNGEANARLIAAAPCMAKLLEDILDSDEISQDQADEIIAILKRINNDI